MGAGRRNSSVVLLYFHRFGKWPESCFLIDRSRDAARSRRNRTHETENLDESAYGLRKPNGATAARCHREWNESPVRRNPDRDVRGIEGFNRKTTMSCRIDRVVSAESRAVLFISGRITGEHVDTLRDVLEKEAGALVIDLKNVFLVDRQAVKLLACCETNGTELRNCPPYIREWITRKRAETKARLLEFGLDETNDIEDV